jgi:pimeloyl-ACP methyl ester carboxylesterase
MVPAPGKRELVPARQLLGDNNPSFKFFAECLSRLDPGVLAANIERWEETYAAYRPDELFPRIQCPVLLLQGRRELGGLMPDRDVEKALGLLPNGRRVRIEKAGHYLHLEDRDAVLRAVTEFLEDLKSAGEGA